METEAQTPAPAQPVETPRTHIQTSAPKPTEVTTVAEAAAAKKDSGAYIEARRAEQAGKPLDVKDTKPATAAEPDDEPVVPISKRQQKINDYERGIAERDQEIARLRAQVQPPAAKVEEPPKPAKEPDYKRFRAMPDAPKLENFDSLEDHAAAMAHFVASVMLRETRDNDARDKHASELSAEQTKRADAFAGRIKEANTDGKFWDAISDDVIALRPLEVLHAGEKAGPGNLIGSEVFSSPVNPQLMRLLSDNNSAELHRLMRGPDGLAALPTEHARASAHSRFILKEIGHLEKTIMAADTPAPLTRQPKLVSDSPEPKEKVVGRRAAATVSEAAGALGRRDTGGYLAARLSEDLARFRR